MGTSHADPVQVWTAATPADRPGQNHGAPGRFRWRDATYQVETVFSRWLDRPDWWAGPAATELRLGVGSTTSVLSGASDPLRELLATCEVWRVEARRTGSGVRGVYDLRRQGPPGEEQWSLSRVAD